MAAAFATAIAIIMYDYFYTETVSLLFAVISIAVGEVFLDLLLISA